MHAAEQEVPSHVHASKQDPNKMWPVACTLLNKTCPVTCMKWCDVLLSESALRILLNDGKVHRVRFVGCAGLWSPGVAEMWMLVFRVGDIRIAHVV